MGGFAASGFSRCRIGAGSWISEVASAPAATVEIALRKKTVKPKCRIISSPAIGANAPPVSPPPPVAPDRGALRIGEFARRVGVSPELLRAWARRYGLLQPIRSDGGFRLYTSEDAERVSRLKAAGLHLRSPATIRHHRPCRQQFTDQFFHATPFAGDVAALNLLNACSVTLIPTTGKTASSPVRAKPGPA